ncbi:MAG: glycosyltransferase [Deltaproteobacteria bacterium]|nr:glycosyltransferase [Deltaproteobacteria bacterium]
MKPNPKASIVIPIRNSVDSLNRVLSGLSCQDFPFPEWEVIGCADGSATDLGPVLQNFGKVIPGLCLVRQKAKGPAAARNLGIRKSAAPMIIFLDSDILPAPNLVKELHAALQENPTSAGVEARIEPLGESFGPLWDGPVCRNGGRFHTAAIAYRRDALLQAGGFDETFPFPACEDVDLAMRVLDQGPIPFLPTAVAYHPLRRITLGTHWRWRGYWKYVMILAKRHGILAFPDHPVGPFPRLQVAMAAVAGLPLGRLRQAVMDLPQHPGESLWAAVYALFDVACGLSALPTILFSAVPPLRNYLRQGTEASKEALNLQKKPSSHHFA